MSSLMSCSIVVSWLGYYELSEFGKLTRHFVFVVYGRVVWGEYSAGFCLRGWPLGGGEITA